MINRITRLSKALWLESLKRLPYVAFVLVIIILAQVYITGGQVAENIRISRQNSASNNTLLQKISGLSEDNKKLSQDNKALSEQNNRLADQSNRYLDCIAQLFAKYTRDKQPIVITDLNSCALKNISTSAPTHNSPTVQAQTAPQKQTATPQAAPAPTRPNSFQRLLRLPESILSILKHK